ncbi:chorismate-binding protein [Pseudotenacibaculum sp. MALMAid0570]|uniref:chorismate-binding protein n=1 Tax=Pseudotenacibaculum sp. MALMAid0570 TaxID=3143938 RepID=UPI0032DEF4C7
MSIIFDKISDQFSKNLPFVCSRKPNEEKLVAYTCKDSTLHYDSSLESEGFVFAPFEFDINGSIIFLKRDCEVLEEEIDEHVIKKIENSLSVVYSDKNSHIDLVNKGIKAIENNHFKKVVLSRKEIVELSKLDLVSTFKRLLFQYKNAMVYVWFHPKVGLWMGATPERLITLEEKKFATMALAGTQKFQGNLDPIWGEKEKKEHQYVVDYIVSQIQNKENGIVLEDFKVSETYTARAGSLLHLKADITGRIQNSNLKSLVKTLHPTPAVCGLPKKAAKQFILENENYSRNYYTGFLGEINTTTKTELFVNLRCVEFVNQHAHIYVGGGVTLKSDSLKEWKETLAKTQTIKSIL